MNRKVFLYKENLLGLFLLAFYFLLFFSFSTVENSKFSPIFFILAIGSESVYFFLGKSKGIKKFSFYLFVVSFLIVYFMYFFYSGDMVIAAVSGEWCPGPRTTEDRCPSSYHLGSPSSDTTGSCYYDKYGTWMSTNGDQCAGDPCQATATCYCGFTYKDTCYGNGYHTGDLTTDQTVTCYPDDWSCSSSGCSNSPAYTLYGNGYHTGDLTTDTSVVCYYGDITCSDGTAKNGTSVTLYGNGYVDGSTCYYGDITCSDGTAKNGTSAPCKCTNCASYCRVDNYCWYNAGCGSSGPYQTRGSYCPDHSYTGGVCYYNPSCDSSGKCSYRSSNSPPNNPSSISVSPSCAGESTSVTVTATISDPDSDNVELQVCKDSSCETILCTSGVASYGSSASCSFTASNACSSTGTCTVYVRTIEASTDPCGYTKASSTVSTSFNYDASAPDAPAGLSPSSGTCTGDTTPTLSWSAPSDNGCGGVTSYHVELYTNADCSGSASHSADTSSTSWTPSALSTGTYSWRVYAVDKFGHTSSWSSCNSISVDASAPSTPSLLSPSSGICTLTNPTLDWSDSSDTGCSGLKDYDVEVDDDSSFSSIDCSASPTTSSYSGCSLSAYVKYYWRVRARDNVGYVSGWSSTWNFITGDSGCNGRYPGSCPSQGYYCTGTCHYVNRDSSSTACQATGSGCVSGYYWFSTYTDGQDAPCCGDDGVNDMFEYAGTENSACVKGDVVNHNSASSDGRYMVFNGEIYYCKQSSSDTSGYDFITDINSGSSVGNCKCLSNGKWDCSPSLVYIRGGWRGGRIKIFG